MSQFTLNGVARAESQQGKGASRRLRKDNLVPAIIYGGNDEAVAICVKTNEIVKALSNESFFSSVITINLDGAEHEVIIKALQRHPSKGFPLHIDFQRIVRGQTMNFNVPVHIINEDSSVGKKVNCLPRNLPEAIEVDVANLAIGDSVHLSDVTLPNEVTLVTHDEADLNRTIATMQPPAVIETADDAEASTEETTEAEVAPADAEETTEE